jgi:hypothetical protein
VCMKKRERDKGVGGCKRETMQPFSPTRQKELKRERNVCVREICAGARKRRKEKLGVHV